MIGGFETGPHGVATHRILMVEDNPADRRLACEMFCEAGVGLELYTVTNGAEALDFLHQAGRFSAAPMPDLVLLDLNLPGINGIEVLSRIRASEELKSLPVIVLSSSRNEKEMARSRELHADAVWRKPFEISDYIRMACEIERFCAECSAARRDTRPALVTARKSA